MILSPRTPISRVPLLTLAVGLGVGLGACTDAGPVAPTTPSTPSADLILSEDVLLHLSGHIIDVEHNLEISVAATKTKQGNTNGEFISPHGVFGTVVELTPPNAAQDWWCVRLLLTNVDVPENFSGFLIVRDLGDGKSTFDEYKLVGLFDSTCKDVSAPISWGTVTDGDILTRIIG